ncbi:hypothetical protein LCGC14_1208110 [marine sediment metagenome]|uniref:Uncharacterized protein n=1 Tax=marine sediment metagenome TaxID=412755 RepID=A0A0F9NX73_9ZZZZ
MKIKILDDEKLEAVVDEWCHEDWATRYTSLNRGHYEDILPIVAQAQAKYAMEQVIEWVDAERKTQKLIKEKLKGTEARIFTAGKIKALQQVIDKLKQMAEGE